MDRTKDAYFSFKKLKNSARHYMIGRKYCHALAVCLSRTTYVTEIYALDASNATITGTENAEEYQNKLREISKSGTYKSFVTEKIALKLLRP
jgi:hydroxymethylglutaryl-CoA synthase